MQDDGTSWESPKTRRETLVVYLFICTTQFLLNPSETKGKENIRMVERSVLDTYRPFSFLLCYGKTDNGCLPGPPKRILFFLLLRAQPVGFLFVPCTTIWKHGKLLYGGGEMKKRKHRFYFACFIRVPEERNNRISGWNLYLILLLQPFSLSFFFLIFCIIFSLPHLKAIFNIRDGKRLKKKGGGGREGGF